jgi:sulfate/thiosulfate transport system substrate-binding protein
MVDFLQLLPSEGAEMTFFDSRLVVSAFIFLASLGGAYGMLNTTFHDLAGDPSYRLHTDLNDAFVKHWKARTGATVRIAPAHSASGKPVRAVIDGLNMTTLVLSLHENALWKNPHLVPLWEPVSPDTHFASPYTSTIVFLVRKGNPKGIKDWNDLLHPGTHIVTSNPKTSENGRWSYLAAWGYGLKQSSGDEAAALDFVKNLFAHVKALDYDSESGKGGAITEFVEHGAGDVLLVWENEAHFLLQEKGADQLQIVTPSISIQAERPVSMAANGGGGVRDVAAAYADYLYTYQAQDIVAKHYYRPRNRMVYTKYADRFPPIDLFTVDEMFGGWHKARKIHFAAGGILEQIVGN